MKRSTIAAALCGLLFVYLGAPAAWSQPASSPWPMFRLKERHTGQSTYKGPDGPGLKWSYCLLQDWIASSPVIDGEGRILLGGGLGDNTLRCLNPKGSLAWSYVAGQYIANSPAVARDGRVYFGAADNRFYCTNANGSLYWSYETANILYCSPNIGRDGKIYVGSSAGNYNWAGPPSPLYCFTPNGTLSWSYFTPSNNWCAPALGETGAVYVSSIAGSSLEGLYCINSQGTLSWSYLSGEIGIFSSPAIGGDGKIYIGSGMNDNRLYALTSKGSLSWSYQAGYKIYSSPAIGKDDRIYVGSNDHRVYGLNSNGSFYWSFSTGGEIYLSSPVIDAAGKIYIGSFDNNLYCLNPDGSFSWSYFGGGPFHSSPAIGSDKTLYVGMLDPSNTLNAALLAIYVPPTPTPTPDPRGAWPMFHKDERNSGKSPYEALSDPTNGATSGMFGGSYYYGYFHYSTSMVNLKWTYTTGGIVQSSPAIGQEGKVFAGSYDKKVYCLDSLGSLLWSYKTGHYVTSSPLAEEIGEVYAGSWDGRLYRFKSDGSLSFSYLTGDYITSSPVPNTSGTRVYVGSWDKRLYAVNADGTLAWTYLTGAKIESSPSIGKNGRITVGSDDKILYCLNPNGSLAWSRATGDAVRSSPSVGVTKTVYVGSLDHRLYRIATDGSIMWTYLTGGEVYSSPALKDGKAYVQSHDHNLHCVNSDGTRSWTYATGWNLHSSPAVDGVGKVYVGSDNNRVYGLNPDGTLSWTYRTGDDVHSSPAIGDDGTLCVGSADGNIYTFTGGIWTEVRLILLYDPPLIRYIVPADLLINPVAKLIRPPYEELVGLRSSLQELLAASDDPEERAQIQHALGLVELMLEATIAEEEGNLDRADALDRQAAVMLVQGQLAVIDEALSREQDPDERQQLQVELTLFQLCLGILEAETAGDLDLAQELRQQVRLLMQEHHPVDTDEEMATQIRINFQARDSGVPRDFLVDDGSPFGPHGEHLYGWR